MKYFKIFGLLFFLAGSSPAAVLTHTLPMEATAHLTGVDVGSTNAVLVGTNKIKRLFVVGQRIEIVPEGPALELISVKYGDGVFLAGGTEGNVFERRTNGNWTKLEGAMPVKQGGNRDDVVSLAFAQGRFAAAQRGYPGEIYLSQTGSWQTNKGFTFFPFRSVASIDGTNLVALTGTPVIFVSSNNGANWEQRTVAGGNWHGAAGNGGGLAVMVGAGGAAVASSDFGAKWTNAISGVTNELTAATFAGDRFIAVGKGGVILESTNGINWSVIPAGAETVANDLLAVAYATEGTLQGLTFAVGMNGAAVILGKQPPKPTIVVTNPLTMVVMTNALTLCRIAAPYSFTAAVEDTNTMTVDWYKPNGELLLTNSLTYVFPNTNSAGDYFADAVTRDSRVTNFVSAPVRVKLHIDELPVVSITPPTNYWRSAGPVDVGTYVKVTTNSGPGGRTENLTFINDVKRTIFDPASENITTNVADPHPNTITYIFTNANGCADTKSLDVLVFEMPVLKLKGAGADGVVRLREDAAPFDLSEILEITHNAGTRTNETLKFTGEAEVTGDVALNPSKTSVDQRSGAAERLLAMTATFKNDNGVEVSTNFSLVIYKLPVVGLSGPVKVAKNAGDVQLFDYVLTQTNAVSGAGRFIGAGVLADGGTFNPATPGLNFSTTSDIPNVVTNIFSNSNILEDGTPVSVTNTLTVFVYEPPTVNPTTALVRLTPASGETALLSYLTIVTNASGGAVEFAGPGTTSGGLFNPTQGEVVRSTTTTNINVVTVVVRNTNDARETNTLNIAVFELPTATPTTNAVVLNRASGVVNLTNYLTLVPSAVSGAATFSGNGVSAAGEFDPAAAGVVGSTTAATNNVIAVTYKNANDVSVTTELNVVVFELPTVAAKVNPVVLNTASEATNLLNFLTIVTNAASGSAVFQGNGVDANGVFTPTAAAVVKSTTTANNNVVTVVFANGNQVKATNTLNVVVYQMPVVTLKTNALLAYCFTNGPVALAGLFDTQVNAAAGGFELFSGAGVTNGVFTPSFQLVGAHTIEYALTNSNRLRVQGSIVLQVEDCRPELGIAYTNPIVTLSWEGAFVLQSATNLTPVVAWKDLTNGAAGANVFTITNAPAPAPAQYFRLSSKPSAP